GKLTGGIAHDYNNLLGVIIGYAELLSSSLSDDKLQKFSNEIAKAGKRGSNLTKKLLAFTKNQSATSSTVNINEILRIDQSMIQKTLTARIKVNFILGKSLWSSWLDAGDFQDAILNMSINAMHAMPDGGEFTVKTNNITISEPLKGNADIVPGDYVQMSLTDTGSGMDEAVRERLFDPFFTTKGEQGSGLGLSQVFGFINRSNGFIDVHSETAKGTTFNLYFKRYNEKNVKIEKNKVDERKPAAAGQKILVVDDEPALKELASEILTNHGYKVFTASDANNALYILEHEDINLVLSDVIMPEIDGYELASLIKEKYPHIKVVLASGYAKQKTLKPEHIQLTNNLLHKPYSSSELIEVISKKLE
ncbi:MAG: response regulator, partial [Gammaproteobacteria bacterium]|nr:response regulator [Gammaproteobacteria bacterium]